MRKAEIHLVQQSWERVEAMGPRAAEVMYAQLFRLDPALRAMFRHTDMREQGERLLMMVGVGVKMLDRFERLRPALAELGERHKGYGVRWEHFVTFGEALLTGLEELLGPAQFTPDCRAAWVELYTSVVTAMHVDPVRNLTDMSPRPLEMQAGPYTTP